MLKLVYNKVPVQTDIESGENYMYVVSFDSDNSDILTQYRYIYPYGAEDDFTNLCSKNITLTDFSIEDGCFNEDWFKKVIDDLINNPENFSIPEGLIILEIQAENEKYFVTVINGVFLTKSFTIEPIS